MLVGTMVLVHIYDLKKFLSSVDLVRRNSFSVSNLTGLLLRGGKVGGGERTAEGRTSPRPKPRDSVLNESPPPFPLPPPAGIAPLSARK